LSVFTGSERLRFCLKYGFKLLLLLLVPGIGSITRGRTKTGLVLLAIFVTASLSVIFFPFVETEFAFYAQPLAEFVLFILVPFSVIVSLIRLKQMNMDRVNAWSFLLLPVAIGAFYQFFFPGNLIYIEDGTEMCPAICQYDGAYISPIDHETTDEIDINPGDIIIYLKEGREFSGRVLAFPGDTVCIENNTTASRKSESSNYCQREVVIDEYQLFIVRDSPHEKTYNLLLQSGIIEGHQIVALNPHVVTDLTFIATGLYVLMDNYPDAFFGTAKFLGYKFGNQEPDPEN